MKKNILALFSFLVILQAYSQNVGDEKLLKRLRYLTYEAYRVHNYNFAIVYAQKADSLEPNQTDILYMLGVSYLYSNTKPHALVPLLKVKKANYKPEEIDYYLGQAYHYNNKFDSAIYYFNKQLPRINTGEDATDLDKEMLREITIGLKQCEYGRLMVLDSAQVEIKNMGSNINTEYSEYLPLVTADESILFFTSRRPRDLHKLDSDHRYFENIYASYHEDSAWSKPVLLGYPINDSHHTAAINISPDGQKIFIYKSRSANEAKGNIYSSTSTNGSLWTAPKKLGAEINSKRGWESSVCVSSSGKRLYFSSDREGGKGGFDIYYSDWDEGKNKWGEPINLGAPINTAANEDAPFIHFDGKTLFFSTDGHETMGGYDVFVSYFIPEKNIWSYPANLGYPINTADDDVQFIYSADGSKGYFASHREDSYGEKDIYTVKNPNPDTKMIVMTGYVLDNESKQPVEATITVTNLETKQVIGVYNTNKETGKYILALNYDVNHSIEIASKSYVFSSENVYVPKALFKKQHSQDFGVKKAALPTVTTNEIYSTTLNSAICGGNVSNDGGIPVMERGVVWSTSSGPTFDMGTKTMDSTGLGTYRSMISGLIPNTTYYVRAYATNGVGTAYGNELTFKTSEVFLTMAIKSDTANSEEIAVKIPDFKNKTFLLDRIKEGARIKLNNIFFDHDKSTLRGESIVELEVLRSILVENPTWLVEISGHTDNNGSDEHNLALSKARSLAVINYLVEKGINPKHLIAIGYGENKPNTDNQTPENRQQNRRTEFMILKTNINHGSTGGHGGKYKPLKMHNVLTMSTAKDLPNSYKIGTDVLFDHDKATLTSESKKQLDLAIEHLKGNKVLKLTLISSVDIVGNEYNNKALYDKRAEAVLNYLLSKGLSREFISIQAFIPTNEPQVNDLSKADIKKRSVLLFVSH